MLKYRSNTAFKHPSNVNPMLTQCHISFPPQFSQPPQHQPLTFSHYTHFVFTPLEELRKDLFREPGNNEGCKWHLLCRLQPPRVYDGVELILRISRNTPICREIIVIIQISAVNIAEITIVGLDRGAQVQLWRVGFCTCPIKPIEKI